MGSCGILRSGSSGCGGGGWSSMPLCVLVVTRISVITVRTCICIVSLDSNLHILLLRFKALLLYWIRFLLSCTSKMGPFSRESTCVRPGRAGGLSLTIEQFVILAMAGRAGAS